MGGAGYQPAPIGDSPIGMIEVIPLKAMVVLVEASLRLWIPNPDWN
jgi:hypothetical protein